MKENIDQKVVKGFGVEWTTFNQSALSDVELENMFNGYFSIFPWNKLPVNATGFDLGCGSGRWDGFVAKRIGAEGKLYCIDPAPAALSVAKQNVMNSNVEFICAGVDSIPFEDNSMDFGFSLGVLHHVPDTQQGIIECVKKLKHGAPFLLYLYYAFDNRPRWFRMLWKCSDFLRKIISRLPHVFKYLLSLMIAGTIYLPLARFSRWMERRGKNVKNYPLSSYKNNSFYTMRTDSYDRFCTRLEQRFTKIEMQQMMQKAGLSSIIFQEEYAFWCAVGYKI